MLIQSGRVENLKGLPWAAIEFYANSVAPVDSRVEETVRNIVKWSRTLKEPFQMLFPVKSRSVDGVQMLSPFLWARTVQLKVLKGVSSVKGVEGLSSNSQGIIEVSDDFVQELIEKTRAYAEARCAGLEIGCFARVLMGSHRMLVGKVLARSRESVTLLIALRTRTVKLDVPVMALENLGTEEREYFYRESQNANQV